MDEEGVRIDDVESLGELLRKGRKAQGLTQQEFAELCLVGTRFISELERGKETAELGLALKVLNMAGYEIVIRPRRVQSPLPPLPESESEES